MAIEAQLADGRILEFPDGTDPSVIQSTVRRVMGVSEAASPAAPTPAPTVPVATTPEAGVDYGDAATGMQGTPTQAARARSVLDKPPAAATPPSTGFLNPQFVQNFRTEVLGNVPPEKRMAALQAMTRAEGVYGMAAREVLKQVQQENATDPLGRAQDERMFKRLRAQGADMTPAAPKFGGSGAPPAYVEVPDNTPTFGDMQEGTASEDIAARRAFAGGRSRERTMDALTGVEDKRNAQLAQERIDKFVQDNPAMGWIYDKYAAGTLKGVTTGLKSFIDIFGADNEASEFVGSLVDGITQRQSSQQKAQSKEAADIMEAAENEGILGQLGAAAKAFAANPAETLFTSLGIMAPMLGGGALLSGTKGVQALGATGARLLGLKGSTTAATTAGAVLTGAGMGVGLAKGAIYDAVLDLARKEGYSPDDAKAIASKAQSYTENPDVIALVSVATAAGAGTGAEPLILNLLGREAAKSLVKRGLIKNVAGALAKDVPLEMVQGGSEKFASNVAAGRMGFDVRPMQGVWTNAGLEALAAGSVAGPAGALASSGRLRDETKQEAAARELAAALRSGDPQVAGGADSAARGLLSGELDDPNKISPQRTVRTARDVGPAPLAPGVAFDPTAQGVPPTQETAQPDMGLGALGAFSPGLDRNTEPTLEETSPAEQQPRNPLQETVEAGRSADAARYNELVAQAVEAGIPEEDAKARALAVVEREAGIRAEALRNRVEALTAEFVGSGIEPAQARTAAIAQARQEAEADALARYEERFAANTDATDTEAGGAGVAVAGGPESGPPTAGVGGLEPAGVAPAGGGAGVPDGREGPAPAAVTSAPSVLIRNDTALPGSPAYDAEVLTPAREAAAEGRSIPVTLKDGTEVNLVLGKSEDGLTGRVIALDQSGEQVGSLVFNYGTMDDGTRFNPSVEVNEDMQRRGLATAMYDLAEQDGGAIPAEDQPGQVRTPEGEAFRKARATKQEQPPKKRGRPVSLTPEERQQRQQDKAPLQALKNRTDRALARINKTLDELAQPLDAGNYESEEAAQEAQAERVAKKRAAIQELLQFQAEPNLRGTKVAERVKKALQHPSITPKELADLKAGLEALRSTTGESASRSNINKEPADSRFSKFTTAAQALSHIIRTGTPFQRALGRRLRAFVGGVRFVVIEQGQELPAQLRRHARDWERSIALYVENYNTGERAIYVRGESFGDSQGLNNTTILHEILHAATNRKVALAIAAIQRGASLNSPLVRSANDLLRTINSAISTYNSMADAGTLPPEIAAIARSGEALSDPREFIAYGMTDPDFQKFLMKAQGFEEDTSFFSRFVDGIRKLFGMEPETVNALSDLIKVTDDILSTHAPKDVKRFLSGERASRTGAGSEQSTKALDVARVNLRNLPATTASGAPPALKRRLDALRRRRDAGVLTDAQFAEEVDALAEAIDAAKYTKPLKPRARGADYIRQRILEAKRRGDIDAEAADLAEWFILQNPALVDSLGISFSAGRDRGVAGQYLDISRIAKIIKERGNTGTIVHEVLHHLERMMPEPVANAIRKEWRRQFLRAQVRASDTATKEFFKLLEDYHFGSGTQADYKAAIEMLQDGSVPIENYQYANSSEFWAVNATRIVEGNFGAVRGGVLTKLKNWLGKTAERVKGLFGLASDAPLLRALNSLSDADGEFVSNKMLMEGVYLSVAPDPEQVEAVKTQRRIEREFDLANQKFDVSKNAEEYAKRMSVIQMLQNPREVGVFLRENWDALSEAARKSLAFAAPTSFLVDAFGGSIPELKNTNVLLQRMKGATLNMLKAAGRLTDEMNRAFRKDRALQAKLDRITHVSTLLEIDPSDKSATKRSAKLDKLWADLGPEGRRLYSRIKNHFEALSDYFAQLLDAQITDSGLPIAERANLMQKIRAMYETGSKITPFFPLVRTGDYWLSIGSGKNRKFFMYETAAERDRAMRKMANKRIHRKTNESDASYAKRQQQNLQDLQESQEYSFGNSISELRLAHSDTSELLKGIFDAIEGSKLDSAESKEALKDAVYQIYLQTMPEQSFRRQFIHRKGLAGFRTDVLRNTAEASTRMATQLARLKYGRALRNSLSQAKDSIANRPKYEPVLAAVKRRVERELNPRPETVGEKVAGLLTQGSFIWYLGSAASALLQPLSIIQTGYPVLMSKYGSVKAAVELGKMLKVWNQYGVYRKNSDGSTSYVMPTVEHASGLTNEERSAVRAMSDFGLTTSTFADAVFDYKNTPSGRYSHPITQFGKDTVNALVLGGLMHTTERMSREIVYLTSFRLNRAAGKSFDEAVAAAVYDTNESLFNYNDYNRPDFMRGVPGKLLTQFMMYPVGVTMFLARNFMEMAKPLDGRTRSEAAKKFFGTMGATFLLAGSIGLPMFSATMGLLGWAAKQMDLDEDDDLRRMDFELWFRTKWLQEQLGETKIAGKSLADIIERGPMNALTGLDISTRTSLNNLWMRDTKETATVRESAAAMALENAGPTANMVLSWAEAYEAFMQGDYAKGAKKATPAGFRNFINAYEQSTKGVQDAKGAKVLSKDAFTTGELIGQAIGFRPDLLANVQYANFKVLGLEQRINNERNLILRQLDREFRKRDMKAFSEYLRERNEFNKKYPTYAITDDNLAESLEGRMEQRAESYRGVTLTDKNLGISRALVPSRRAASEKEREGREGK